MNHSLPHHKLIAYQVALEFLRVVHQTRIQDAEQRAQARKSAKSVVRNIAEGAGRWSRADKARVYAIARGELCEACAAVEIAVAIGCASSGDLAAVQALGKRLSDLLGRLIG
ncbi:MAG TPA: four helix bundle protein [Polyangiaceae bacterium]